VRDRSRQDAPTWTPPDGLAAGLIARRTLERGAWIAPANEPLPDVLALAPPVQRDDHLPLMNAGLNLIVQQPRGFVPLTASTLTDDDDLVPISVRRLMSLLRRLALREGATYVFEPNDGPFQRAVQRGFEGMLARMFERGAFAGPTASTAFQVVTSASVNTPQSVDAGRFIVELRVAPSRPMTFLTVRLVQSADRATVVEGR
jgi:phage tail sheath protein FI